MAGTTDASAVYVNAGGSTTKVDIVGGAFSYDAPLSLGTNTITVVAEGSDGGTSTVQRTVTSTNFGDEIGTISDPQGDDNGPGTYVYPTNDAFNDGAFDLTKVGIYDDGTSYNFVTTIGGDLRNPWGGNQISVQRMDFYINTGGAGTGPVDALPGTNATLASPYTFVVTGSGFATPVVRDAGGTVIANASLLAIPGTRQVAVSVPKTAFGSADLAAATYGVTMMSHADTNEGVGGIRPVYAKDYWDASPGNGMSWIQEYRFGGGAGEFTDGNPARDTDSGDPNVMDILVPAGQAQGAVLDWTANSPVVLPYVPLS